MKHWFNEDKSIRLYNGDCLEVMDKLIECGIKVDLVICDPAYKCISGGKTKGNRPTGILSKNDGKHFLHNDIHVKNYAEKMYNILEDESHFYLMTNFINLDSFMSELKEVGFKLHNLLIWKKNNCTPSQWYMKDVEYIIFGRKGKAKYINNIGTKTVLEVDNIIGGKLHPSEKPVELMEILVGNSSKEYGTVLDFMCGSGSTGVACKNLNRRFIGIELDENYFDIAVERIKGVTNEN